jgi:hypothetical protein
MSTTCSLPGLAPVLLTVRVCATNCVLTCITYTSTTGLRRAHILLALVSYCTTCTTSTTRATSTTSATNTTSGTSTTISTYSTNQSALRLTVPVPLLPTVLYYCHCCWCAYDGVPVPVSVVVPVQKPVSVPVPAPVLSAAAANRY